MKYNTQPIAEVMDQAITKLEKLMEHTDEQKAELLKALIGAKKLIKTWHDIGCGDNADGLWAIYEELSPEMKPINEAIKKAIKKATL